MEVSRNRGGSSKGLRRNEDKGSGGLSSGGLLEVGSGIWARGLGELQCWSESETVRLAQLLAFSSVAFLYSLSFTQLLPNAILLT